MKISHPATPEEFEKYYRLRYQVLRQPWQQPPGSERAPDDDTATHAMLLDDDQEVVGVCRLHQAGPAEAQIRFMAVRPDKQGRGVGRRLLAYCENIARRWGVTHITLQARENAVNFYARNGYLVVEKTHMLFGEIQHYKMVKPLTHTSKPMKKNTRDLVIAAGTIVLGTLALRRFSRTHQPLEVVSAVDLTRYAGKWYEIAAFPMFFERGCHCTTAEYTLHPAGNLQVVNTCHRKSPQGKRVQAVGTAWPVPGSNNAKLKVQLQWPFKGDYWILALDEDYSYALVGTPDRQYLWILSRTPYMAPTLYQNLVHIAQQKGFDTDHLHLTNQSCQEQAI